MSARDGERLTSRPLGGDYSCSSDLMKMLDQNDESSYEC